jgi:hypothetical protein
LISQIYYLIFPLSSCADAMIVHLCPVRLHQDEAMMLSFSGDTTPLRMIVR